MADKASRLENQILHFSRLEKWTRVEAHWTEVLEHPPVDPKFYATLAHRMVQGGKAADLRSWISLLAEYCLAGDLHRALIQAARGVLTAAPEFEELRQPLLSALRAQYVGHPQLERFIEESGLTGEPALAKPLHRFLQFIHCADGEVFQHAVWGVGRVAEIDTREGRALIDFPGHGRRSLSFEGVREFLKRIPRSHLFAQRLLNPQGLAKRAESDPVEFLKYCLKSLGGTTTQGDLKEHLLLGVFDARQWASWWNRNRRRFRLDPYIGFTGSPGNAQLRLRSEARSFCEEILAAFEQNDSFASHHGLVADVVKHREVEPIPEGAVRRILAILQERLAACAPEEQGRRAEYLFLLKEVQSLLSEHSGDGEAEAFALLDAAANPLDVLSGMSVAEYQIRAATHLRDAAGDRWPERAEEIFLYGPTRVAQWVLRDLAESGNTAAASHVAEQILHRAHLNPDLFLWTVRAARGGKWADLHIEISPEALFAVVMELIEDCRQRIEREDTDATGLRGLQSRLSNLLMDNHHAIVSDAFKTYRPEQARETYRSLMQHPSLSESFKASLDHALRGVRDDLDEAKTGPGGAAAEHFVTAAAFEAKQKEYQRLKNEEIPAISKAIGDAARLGDLSENAEYHAAKDRQKTLFRRLEQLEDLLQRARILDATHVSTEVIGVGTAFEIRNLDSGEVEHYGLLGLWDADPERHILSYLTPFGMQFLNRKTGDALAVTDPGGGSTRYEVLRITNALLPPTPPAGE